MTATAVDRRVDKIAFTGSTAVGKRIIGAATGNLKKVTLELGGKSPNVVFADADMDQAIPGAASAIVFNHGQVCSAGSRLYVEDSAFDEVTEGVAEQASRMKVGPPWIRPPRWARWWLRSSWTGSGATSSPGSPRRPGRRAAAGRWTRLYPAVTGTGLFNRVAVGRASRARSVRALDSTPTAEPLPRRGARGRTSRRPRTHVASPEEED
jgi:Aldehyde dehydrogenase family